MSIPLKILIIDDNINYANLLKRYLEKSLVCEISTLASIENIENLLGYDCILLDYYLQNLTGLDVLNQIRESKLLYPPIIIMTAQGNEEIAVEALKAGACDYMVKGWERKDFTRLILNIQQVVNAYELEQKLKKTQLRYQNLIETSPHIIIVFEDMNIVFVNQAGIKILGYSLSEFQSLKDPFILINPEKRNEIHQLFHHQTNIVKKIGKSYISRQLILISKNGKFIPTLANIITYCADDGKIISQGEFTDLRSIKALEKANVESEKRYHKIFELAQNAFVLLTLDKYYICEVNKRLEEIFGYTQSEILSLEEEGKFHFWKHCILTPNLLEKLKEEQNIHFHNVRGQTKDKQLLWLELSATLVELKGETYILATLQDFTKAHSLQRQLFQSEKMAALSQLVGGIAHELNNPLGAIIGYTELLLNKINDTNHKQKLKNIHSMAIRVSQIVEYLLTFTQQSQTNKKELSINTLIRNAILFREKQINKLRIPITFKLGENLPSIIADSGQLLQVFLNLILNAEQALQEIPTKQRKLIIHTYQKEDNINIDIENTGKGIPEILIDKIFEPFFSTREVGKGVGMGLSTAYGIICEHKGNIIVFSDEKITRFQVTLPIAP